MDETDENHFNLIPNEIILMIFANLDRLTDRSNLAQVCHRFNTLANDRTWRKNIYISEEELNLLSDDKSMRFSCVDKLAKEIKHSVNFETLVIKVVDQVHGLCQDVCPRRTLRRTTATTTRNTDEANCIHHMEDLLDMIEVDINRFYSNYIAECRLFTSTNLTHCVFFFTPKYEGVDYGRTIRYHTTNTTKLEICGKYNKVLDKIVNNCKVTPLVVTYEGEMTAFI